MKPFVMSGFVLWRCRIPSIPLGMLNVKRRWAGGDFYLTTATFVSVERAANTDADDAGPARSVRVPA